MCVSAGRRGHNREARVTEVFLRRLSRWQAEQQREAIADVYVEAYHGARGEEFHDRQDFLARFADDVQRTGFDMVIASEAELAGCAYGFPADRGGGLWEGFRGELPEGVEELTASGRVFVVAELMVVPPHRRVGVGHRMLEQLLARGDGAELLTAVVDPENAEAMGALRAWGWTKTGDLVPPVGVLAPVLEAWSRSVTP
jgi:GNAT superfamily N-acetyltransferase